MHLDTIAVSHESTAFAAYHSLVSPALRKLVRRPLCRALHDGRPCVGGDGSWWCADCEATVDDHLLVGYSRLRQALAGMPPCTRAGESVRELETVARWVRSPGARQEHVDNLSHQLRRPPSQGELAAVRAARAQLVHYPLVGFEARMRRAHAMSRGASARPDRDLGTARWAEPLRDDPIAFELLKGAVARIRDGGRDPYDIAACQLESLGLDSVRARRLLRDTLSLLSRLRPEFYRANVAVHQRDAGCLTVLPNTVSSLRNCTSGMRKRTRRGTTCPFSSLAAATPIVRS